MNNIEDASHQLYLENKEYYQKLAAYIRYGSWFKSESKVEDFLSEVRADLLDAQKEGLSAEVYFGKNPRASADDLLASLESKWFEVLKIYGIVLATYTFFLFVTVATTVNILSVLIHSLVITVATLIIFIVLKKGIYKKPNRLQLALTILAMGSLLLYDFTAEKTALVIPLPYFPVATIVIIGALGGTIYYFTRAKENEVVWQIGLVAIWSSIFMGLANHVIIPFLASL